jgi:hypothetical protein
MYLDAQSKRVAAAHLRAMRVVGWWPALIDKRRHGGWASKTR